MTDINNLIAEGRTHDAAMDAAPWRTEGSKYISGRYVIAPDDRQIVHAGGSANRAVDGDGIAWMRNNLTALLDRLEAVQALAVRWMNEPNDYDEDTEQRITDGWALQAVLTAGPFDLDELHTRTLRLRREADAASRGVPFNEADYEDDGHTIYDDEDWDE